jgi:hypothetical protein
MLVLADCWATGVFFGLGVFVGGALRFLVDGATGVVVSARFGTTSASVSFAGISGAAVCVAENAAFGCCFALTMVMTRVGSGWVGLGWGRAKTKHAIYGTTFGQKREHAAHPTI